MTEDEQSIQTQSSEVAGGYVRKEILREAGIIESDEEISGGYVRRDILTQDSNLPHEDPSIHYSGQRMLPSLNNNVDEFDIEALRFIHEDSKAVLGHQIEYLNDIDDKAMRTVRIVTILLGVIFSATQLPFAESYINNWLLLGGGSLILSIVFGIITYTVSDPHFGVGPEYLDDIVEMPYGEQYWRVDLITSYADWMTDNEKLNSTNATYLFYCQLFSVIGLLLLAVGVVLEIDGGGTVP